MSQGIGSVVRELKRIVGELGALLGLLQRVDEALETALKASEISRVISDLMTQLYTALEAAHVALMALGNVPYVNLVAKPLAQVVGKMKDALRPVKESLERLESNIAPLRKQLKAALEPLRAQIKPLRALGDFLEAELGLLERTGNAVASAPGGRYRRAGEERLAAVAAGIAEVAAGIAAELRVIAREVEAMEPEIEAALAASEGLVAAARLLTDLVGDLEEVKEDTAALSDLLDRRVDGGRTIRQVLGQLGGLPKEVVQPVMDALAEPLSGLKAALGLKLPDPGALIAGFQAIQRRLDALSGALEANNGRLATLTDLKAQRRRFDAVAP